MKVSSIFVVLTIIISVVNVLANSDVYVYCKADKSCSYEVYCKTSCDNQSWFGYIPPEFKAEICLYCCKEETKLVFYVQKKQVGTEYVKPGSSKCYLISKDSVKEEKCSDAKC